MGIGNSAVHSERTKLQKLVIATFCMMASFKDAVSDPVPVDVVDHSQTTAEELVRIYVRSTA